MLQKAGDNSGAQKGNGGKESGQKNMLHTGLSSENRQGSRQVQTLFEFREV
jgi:hypothetical protein